jgi:antitoxin (DNA-binding transcriptional repressor) of toxin-antitoxin stability system
MSFLALDPKPAPPHNDHMQTVFFDVSSIRFPPGLLKEIREGKEVVITADGSPVARLSACEPKPIRQFGLLKGQIVIPENFDDPMPDEWFGADDKFSK